MNMLIKQVILQIGIVYQLGHVFSIGLKDLNSNKLSYKKVEYLKNNNNLLEKYFPSGLYYTLELSSKDNNDSLLITGDYYKLNTLKQVHSITRNVVDYGYEIYNFTNDDNLSSNENSNSCILSLNNNQLQ